MIKCASFSLFIHYHGLIRQRWTSLYTLQDAIHDNRIILLLTNVRDSPKCHVLLLMMLRLILTNFEIMWYGTVKGLKLCNSVYEQLNGIKVLFQLIESRDQILLSSESKASDS